MKRKRPFRFGDSVEIVKPLFVARVGYPKTLEDYLPQVDKYLTDIHVLLEHVVPRAKLFSVEDARIKSIDRIRNQLAWLAARADGFGGNRREIHWREIPEEQGQIRTVLGVRSVMTGVRSPGSHGFFGEDSEGPSLEDAKQHRLVTVAISNGKQGQLNRILEVEIPTYHIKHYVEKDEEEAA